MKTFLFATMKEKLKSIKSNVPEKLLERGTNPEQLKIENDNSRKFFLAQVKYSKSHKFHP